MKEGRVVSSLPGGHVGGMGILADLFRAAEAKGKSRGSDRVRAAETALQQLREQRDEAYRRITEAIGRRPRMLLDDASDEALLKLDDEVDRARLLVERLDAGEAELLQRLTDARDADRRERWAALVDEHDRVAAQYLSAMRTLVEHYDELVGVRERAAGFAEVQHRMLTPPVPHVVDHSVLHRLEVELDRRRGLSEASEARQPVRQIRKTG